MEVLSTMQDATDLDKVLTRVTKHRVFRCCKILDKIYYNNFQLKIRKTKHDLIVKLITRMDGKSRDESIKSN